MIATSSSAGSITTDLSKLSTWYTVSNEYAIKSLSGLGTTCRRMSRPLQKTTLTMCPEVGNTSLTQALSSESQRLSLQHVDSHIGICGEVGEEVLHHIVRERVGTTFKDMISSMDKEGWIALLEKMREKRRQRKETKGSLRSGYYL